MILKKLALVKTLNSKIVALLSILAIILGITASAFVKHFSDTSQNAILETYLTYSHSLQSAIAAQFFERYGDTKAFALNPVFRSKNQTEAVKTLNEYVKIYKIYDLIMLLDLDGNLLAANNQDSSGKPIKTEALYKQNFQEATWFRSAKDGVFTENKSKTLSGVYFEDPKIDPISTAAYQEERYGTTFSTPLLNSSGIPIGILTTHANGHWFEHEFEEFYQAMKKTGILDVELTLLDKNGTLLVDFRPNPKDPYSEVSHNYETLNHFNLYKVSNSFAELAEKGQATKLISVHARKKNEQATGFSPVSDKRFINELGWSILVRTDKEAAFGTLLKRERLFYGLFALITALILGFSSYFIRNLIEPLRIFVLNKLSNSSLEVGIAATELKLASSNLSNASTQQAEALQETAAAVEQISSMMKRSSELAGTASETSLESRKKAERGNEIVLRMTESMQNINKNNSAITSELSENNQKLESILKVIQEVGNKTKVINDIVFQTKLLSFNASVEAARAGEHGKGFAVVAEEVGNLAQMSGRAAKEINILLDESLNSVSEIVAETKNKVARIMDTANQSTAEGIAVANECGAVLIEIVSTSTQASEMVASISQASRESSNGVSEIAKALQQLDHATHTNSVSASSCFKTSEMLAGQIHELRQASSRLNLIIEGRGLINNFEWKENYLLHVEQMDTEHKILVEKINALAEALRNDSKNTYEKFGDLAAWTQEHFKHEEAYIDSIRFPGSKQHKEIHTKLISRVLEFGAELKQNRVDPAELMTFLNDWLLNHILGTDMKYADYSREIIETAKYTAQQTQTAA